MSIIATVALLAATPHSAIAPSVTLKPLRVMEGVRALAFAAAPSGSLFAAPMEDGTIRVINAASGATVVTMKGAAQPGYGIAWSHNGKWIASGDESGRIYFWNAKTGKMLKQNRKHIRGIQNLSFNKDDTMLLSTGKEDVVKIFDVATNKVKLNVLGNAANFYGAVFAPNSNEFTVGILGAGARVYTPGGKLIRTLAGHSGLGVWDVAYNPSGTRVATAGRDNHAILWDSKRGAMLGTCIAHAEWVFHVAFSPNGALLATGSQDRSVRLWNVSNFANVASVLNTTSVASPVCFTRDGKYLLTVNQYDYLQVTALNPAQGGIPPKPVKKKAVKKTRRRRHH